MPEGSNVRFDGACLVRNFEGLNPANTLWGKNYELFANVDSERERFLEFERWWTGFYFLSREEITAIVENLFIGNKLESGEMRICEGCVADLKRIRNPLVIFASYGDNITPPHRALNWVPTVYGTTEALKKAGQRIAYLINPHVGHLGIFVSASVAKLEHRAILASLNRLEKLPLGLYEMKVASAPELSVTFEESRVEDIRFDYPREAFEKVRQVSELNEYLWVTFATGHRLAGFVDRSHRADAHTEGPHEQDRATGVTKSSVGEVASYARAAGLKWEEARALDDEALQARVYPPPAARSARHLEPEWAQVHQQLKSPGVTLQLLWEEYRLAHGPQAYKYSAFCEKYAGWARHLKRSMRLVHKAGERLLVDHAGQTAQLVDALTEEISRAQIFVAVLGASNYTFACATPTQQAVDWTRSIIAALEFFGGVPRLLVPDQPRALIANPDRYEPTTHRLLQELADHYGIAVLPARPAHPRDKAKVEVGVQVVERWILARLRERTFTSLGELNRAIAGLLEQLNARPFKKLPGCRRSAFEELDRPALRHGGALANGAPAAPRAGLSLLPGPDAPGARIRHRAAGGRLRAGPVDPRAQLPQRALHPRRRPGPPRP